MEYLAVRCADCQKEFAVERIEEHSQVVHFRRASFRASYTCPHCDATYDYGFDDLMPLEWDSHLQPQYPGKETRFRKRW